MQKISFGSKLQKSYSFINEVTELKPKNNIGKLQTLKVNWKWVKTVQLYDEPKQGQGYPTMGNKNPTT